MDMPMKVKDKVSSFLCLYNDKTKNLLLPSISISNVLRNNGDAYRVWICHEQDQSQSASPSKLNIQFAGSTTLPYWEGHNSFIWSEFEFHEHLMDFNWIQSHINITSSRSSTVGYHDITVGLLFTFDTLAQVGTCRKEMENTPRSQARASKPSWRPNPCQVRVHLGLKEQRVVKQMHIGRIQNPF